MYYIYVDKYVNATFWVHLVLLVYVFRAGYLVLDDHLGAPISRETDSPFLSSF